MQIRATNLPHVTTETQPTIGPEITACDVEMHGTYIGRVVYVRRQLKAGGSEYGWRPDRGARKLTSKTDAIRRLPRFAD